MCVCVCVNKLHRFSVNSAQALDGFIMIVDPAGTVLFVSSDVADYISLTPVSTFSYSRIIHTVHEYMHACTYVCMYVCTYVCMCVRMYV